MKWRTVIYIFLFVLLFWGLEHSRRSLWEPDEARYAYVAREMMQDGHWAVPHRHGEYYAHKPPLYFWLVRLAVKLTGRGVDGITARLPSLLASFVTLLVTGLFAAKLFGRKAVLPSVLVLATCFLYWHEGGMGRMDSVLLALDLCALFFLLKGDDNASTAWRAAAYVLMGLGVLTKGPVGLLVPLIVYLAVRKASGKRILAAHLAWGLPLALLFPLIWLAAAWIEGAPEEYFQELIFKQNFGRLSSKVSFGKPRPFYFYLIHVPAEFLPWTLLLPASVIALKRAGKKLELKMLASWALAVLIFFTLSSGKRNLYVLLAYPAMALLIGGGCLEFGSLSSRWKKGTVIAAVSLMLLIGFGEVFAGVGHKIAAAVSEAELALPVSLNLMLPAGLALLAGAAVTIAVYRKHEFGRTVLLCFGLAFAIHWALISNILFPALNDHKTPVEALEFLEPYAEGGDRMIIYGTTSEIVPLYCGMKSRSAADMEELGEEMISEKRGIVVFRKKAREELEPVLPGVELLGECKVGHKTMVLVGFGR